MCIRDSYYTKEDVENAAIVFDEVSFLEVRSQGALPNDFIHELTVVGTENGKTTVEIRIGCAEASGSSGLVGGLLPNFLRIGICR